jgi:hypothetical protein
MPTTFVRYNKKGDVLATIRVDEVPDDLDLPFGDLAEGEAFLRLDPGERRANEMPLLELHERWRVNVRSEKLVRRRPRRGRKETSENGT